LDIEAQKWQALVTQHHNETISVFPLLEGNHLTLEFSSDINWPLNIRAQYELSE
jgi:hypothetical protein